MINLKDFHSLKPYLLGFSLVLTRSLLFILILALSGCLTIAKKPAQPLQRGWFDIDDGQAFYRPCFSSERFEVNRYPAAINRYKTSRSKQTSIYIEWLGDLNHTEDDLHIGNLRLLSDNPRSCHQMHDQSLMVAYGDNNRWNVQIKDDFIQVFIDDRRQTLRFPHEPAVVFGNQWIWSSKIELPTGVTHRLELTIEPESFCRAEDDWFSFSANLIVNGREFTGCARRGMLDIGMLNTHYQFPFYVSTRSFDLYLEPDGSVFLREDYHGIQPVVESYGSWQMMPDRRLMIQFAYNQDMLRQEVLVFAIANNGVLVMEQGHSRYGPLGLELVPSGRSMTLDQSILRKVPQ